MPKRKRDFDKRRLGYALGCLDNAMSRILELKAPFDEVLHLDPMADDYEEKLLELTDGYEHARLDYALYLALMTCHQAEELLSKFALSAWGIVPDNVRKWTNTGQDWKEAQMKEEATDE